CCAPGFPPLAKTEPDVFQRKWSRRTISIAAIAAVLLLVAGIALRARTTVEVAQVPFSDLLKNLNDGTVTELVVTGDTLDFKLKAGQTFRTVAPANYVTANAAF